MSEASLKTEIEWLGGEVYRLKALLADVWLTPAGNPKFKDIERQVLEEIGAVDRSGLSEAHRDYDRYCREHEAYGVTVRHS